MEELSEFHLAVIREDFPLATRLAIEHDEKGKWPPLEVVGDRYWSHLANYCSIDGLKFLHYELKWDLDTKENGDDYQRTLITIFAHNDRMDLVKAMHEMGYHINTNHLQLPICDGPYSDYTPIPRLKEEYSIYCKK